MIPFLINSCSDKNKVREKRVSNSYVNWMSYKYMKCLHNDLPCNCESLNNYFLVSTDTANKTVLFYKAESHYEYNLFKLKQL